VSSPSPPMPPDKISQFRRQRELVQQHLDWLDTEIANHSDGPPTLPNGPAPIVPALEQAEPAEADIVAPDMKPDPISASTEAKRGCLILFFAVIGLLVATLVGIYFWKYRDRPLLFTEATDANYSHFVIG